jgi:hypothetical protein
MKDALANFRPCLFAKQKAAGMKDALANFRPSWYERCFSEFQT